MKDGFGRIAGSIGVVSLLVLCLTVGVWGQQGFSYSEESSSVVLSYSRTPGELAGADRSTTVTVYGDGRVVVHYPPYGQRQGDYTMTLIKAELDELIASMLNKGVIEFDGQAAEAEKQAVLDAQGLGFHVSDADVTTIEGQLASYNPTGEPGQESFDVRRELTFSALQSDANQFPSIQSLVNLAAAERELINLTVDQDLAPTP